MFSITNKCKKEHKFGRILTGIVMKPLSNSQML